MGDRVVYRGVLLSALKERRRDPFPCSNGLSLQKRPSNSLTNEVDTFLYDPVLVSGLPPSTAVHERNKE